MLRSKLLHTAALLLCATASVSAQEPSYPAPRTAPGVAADGSRELRFTAHRLGRDHAEGVTALDFDGDGWVDLASGAYRYRNPGASGGAWSVQRYRSVDLFGEFVDDAGEWTIDVDHDGKPDVVTIGWREDGVFWWKNPGRVGGRWERRRITDSAASEGGVLADINGDGKPDLIVSHYSPSRMVWIDFAGTTPVVHRVGGVMQDGHGVGAADLDGDGRPDIVTPFGWFHNVDANADRWAWHPDWHLGRTGFPILLYDVNYDGRTDLVFGEGHSYGLYWLEQSGPRRHPRWIRHIIDESFSQAHALSLVDLDGDGVPELVTGKRYRGHEGRDPGSYDPIGLYYYKIDRTSGRFMRYVISLNGTAGAGTRIVTGDFDRDGDMDIAVAGKTGLHLIENLAINRVTPKQREGEIVLEKVWPFAGEGQPDAPPQ